MLCVYVTHMVYYFSQLGFVLLFFDVRFVSTTTTTTTTFYTIIYCYSLFQMKECEVLCNLSNAKHVQKRVTLLLHIYKCLRITIYVYVEFIVGIKDAVMLYKLYVEFMLHKEYIVLILIGI